MIAERAYEELFLFMWCIMMIVVDEEWEGFIATYWLCWESRQ
jgi:hypothetical protein